MFGYTLPMYSKMSSSDLATYRRYYCETCHQLKSEFGLVSTAAVNYDMTFNTIILNAVAGDVIDFARTKNSPLCVFKKPNADSDLFRKMAAYTILLTKWELVDDTIDKPSMKTNFISLTLSKAINKAEKMYPEYDNIVGKGFEELHSLELSGCTDAIKMGNRFGQSLSVALNDFAERHATKELSDLFIELSTMVYVMDAVDDLDEDYMDNTYNPYLKDCTDFINKKDYISKHIYDITDSINSVVGALQSAYLSVRKEMKVNTGVADNIIYYGLPDSAKKIISGNSVAKASVKNALSGHKQRNSSY